MKPRMHTKGVCALVASLALLISILIGCKKESDNPVDPSPVVRIPTSVAIEDYAVSHRAHYRNGDSLVITERDSMYFRCLAYDAQGIQTRDSVIISLSGNAPCAVYTRKLNDNIFRLLVAGSLPSNAFTATTTLLSEVPLPNKQPVAHVLKVTVAKRYITNSQEPWRLHYFPFPPQLYDQVYFSQFGDSIRTYAGIIVGRGCIREGVFRFDCVYPVERPPISTSIKYILARFNASSNLAEGFYYSFNGDSVQIRWIRG